MKGRYRVGAQAWALAPLLLMLLWVPLATPAAAQRADAVWNYTVRPGDDIWTISRRILVDGGLWKEVQARNAVERPRALRPGTRLAIPVAWLRTRPAPTTALDVEGEAVLERGAGPARPLRAGDALEAGDRLRTGDEASLVIGFSDGSTLQLYPRTEIVLRRLGGYYGAELVDVLVELERGRLASEVEKLDGGASTFELHSPAMISAVRGTDFRVSFADDTGGEGKDGRGTTEVLRGEVTAAAAGARVALPAGFGTFSAAGAPPAPPEPLLPAAKPVEAAPKLERLPLEIALEPVETAVAYRVQVAPPATAGGTFQPLLVDRLGDGPRLRLPDLPDGIYRGRARAVAASGLEGLDGDFLLEVDARPLPPALLRPTRDATLRDPGTSFAWAAIEGAPGYRLQVAGEPGFEAPLIDRAGLTENGFTADRPLAPGTYRWRVATMEADGGQGPFGDASTFEKRAPPPVPERIDAEGENGRVVLNLGAVEPGRRYGVQIARDRAMRDIVADEVVDGSSFAMNGLPPATYYFRARVLEADGYEGAFGPVQSVEVPAWPYWPVVPLLFLLFLL